MLAATQVHNTGKLAPTYEGEISLHKLVRENMPKHKYTRPDLCAKALCSLETGFTEHSIENSLPKRQELKVR